ncbi:hypothetical protein DFH08DRAFT_75946 [Mycena albidolilacea]|uniref:Uncharacterized protein n=1 Tax=Mycena albidolilacea TaxID=1033008 RepID=A0AAD7E8H2_9AGAR|nr:hypothetical protein DFH08DRAFT_75946 [Mycena albidolilacea]
MSPNPHGPHQYLPFLDHYCACHTGSMELIPHYFPLCLKKLLPIWVERARNRPLSISLEGVFDQDIVGIIWGHSQQLKHFQICEEGVYNDEHNGELWKGTPPGSLPSPETLEIRGCGYSDEEDRGLFSLRHLLDLLHRAPNLVCILLPEDLERHRR